MWLLGGRRALRKRTRLSASDRKLAALGARLAAEQPALAHELARYVEQRIPQGDHLSAAQLATRARRTLLRAERHRREIDRGEVVIVDGWLLSRSEVAVCAYLHRLDTRASGMA